MTDLGIWKPCPLCHKTDSIVIRNNRLICTHSDCSFVQVFGCPICDAAIPEEAFFEDKRGIGFLCGQCRHVIPVQKIQYLIHTGMRMDYQKRCVYCNSPTLHRQDMNVMPRCFFYPKCSGQADLFESVRDSFVFIDFETTGLEIGRDALTEVGCVKLDEEGFEHTFQSFIKPPFPIDPRITALTGITNEMVQHAPSLKDVLSKLIDFIGSSKIVAHNADFDIPWLFTSLIRHQMNLPNNDLICTLRWARQNEESHSSLGALGKKYKIGHHNAHRALADAMVTKEIFLIYEFLKKTAHPLLVFDEYWALSQRIADKYHEHVQV